MELDKIYNMDCLEGMKQIPDGSVDAIICDLPYGITSCDWDVIIPFDKLWEQYKRIAKATAPIALFCREPFTSIVVQSNLKCYRHKWVWNKKQSGSFVNSKYMPLQIDEDIIVFSLKTPCNYYPIMKKGIFRKKGGSNKVLETMKGVDTGHYTFNDDYYPTNILEYNKERGLHPTQKPVDLLRYLVRTYSNEGDTILDNCMGSGTTAVACIKEKRHFIGFELNKDYYDKACQRIDAEKRQLTLF